MGYYTSHITSSKFQIQKIKEFKLEKSRPKKLKLAKKKIFALLYSVPILQSPEILSAKIRKKNILKKSRIKKALFWLLETMLLKILKRNKEMPVK